MRMGDYDSCALAISVAVYKLCSRASGISVIGLERSLQVDSGSVVAWLSHRFRDRRNYRLVTGVVSGVNLSGSNGHSVSSLDFSASADLSFAYSIHKGAVARPPMALDDLMHSMATDAGSGIELVHAKLGSPSSAVVPPEGEHGYLIRLPDSARGDVEWVKSLISRPPRPADRRGVHEWALDRGRGRYKGMPRFPNPF